MGTDSEIIVMLGENGTGKTTFITMLAGLRKPDDKSVEIPELMVSYKPQKISPNFQSTVRDLLLTKIRQAFVHPQFNTDVLKPLMIEELLDQEVVHLSGGELQRVAICLCLGKPADVYLIDEPSAYLDSEQRIVAAKVIKRFILHAKKTAFIVEHDFIMATYLADRVVVYEGQPSVCTVANSPQDLLSGMNLFLRGLDLTIRRDPFNYRPRINKAGSVKDREQKATGNYFYMMSADETNEGVVGEEGETTGKKPRGKHAKAAKANEALQAAKEHEKAERGADSDDGIPDTMQKKGGKKKN